MIKFFRKIRHQLLAENKFSKYLIYAIGEIILVVIGILIALQINNWNEIKKQQIVEIEILDGIKNDILLDTIDLNYNISVYKIFQKNDSLILNHLINKKKKEKSVIKLLEASVALDLVLNLHNSYFEEAKVNGLSIISNQSLRNRISRLYEFRYKTMKLLENSTPSFDTHKFLVPEFGQYFGVDSAGVTMNNASYEKLISNGAPLYYLREAILYRNAMLGRYEETLNEVLMVVDSIDVELTKLKK